MDHSIAESTTGPTGTSISPPRSVCPICLSTELRPENQCTLRCGHALCNLCLPQLLSPNCPLCRRPIWEGGNIRTNLAPNTTPWLLDSNTMLLDPAQIMVENSNNETDHDISSLSTNDQETETESYNDTTRIPVMLLTREQIRSIFSQ